MSDSAMSSAKDEDVTDLDLKHWSEWSRFGDEIFDLDPMIDTGLRTGINATHSRHIASSKGKGEGRRGKLVSPTFLVSRPYLNFWIAGGDHEFTTCVNLVVDSEIVRSETGRSTDGMHPVTFDLTAWLGCEAHLELVDHASDLGYVCVTLPILSSTPQVGVDAGSLYEEALRPQLHFTARQWAMRRLNPTKRQEGWLNDLNGLVYLDGEYHLFAQRWSTCWIHAVSPDLVHWTEIAPAFFEEELGTGVQSGTCVVDYENTAGFGDGSGPPPMVAFWSRNDNRSQCVSYSLDRGRTWSHYSGNPIMELPERDPMVFRDHRRSQWVMILYGNRQYQFLRSLDLLHWESLDCLIPDSYECPDFFELEVAGSEERKWVLVRGDGRYSVGSFDGRSFIEETPQLQVDAGPNFYATQSWGTESPGGPRRAQVAWMRGGSYPGMPFNQQVSIPCDLSLHRTDQGLRVFRTPVPELAQLVRDRRTWSSRDLEPGESWRISSAWRLLRLTCELEIDSDAELVVTVCGIDINVSAHSIALPGVQQPTVTPMHWLDMIVDTTSVEVFANHGEASLSACSDHRSSGHGTPGVVLTARRGKCVVRRPEVQALDSIWKHRQHDQDVENR